MKSKEDNTQKKTKKLSSKELSWVLYDVGNSAYTLLACALIPIWYKSLAVGDGAGQISSDRATAYYAMAIAVMTVVSALIGPVCGAIADHMRIKKAIFSTTVVVGVSACILNGFTPTWVLFLVIYVLTKIFYNASLVFYDSMLVDVTTKDRMDEVSSYGYAWGYLGSCVPFLVSLAAYICGPDMLGYISNRLSMIIGFAVTGIWWFVVTIPLFKSYKQVNYVSDVADKDIHKNFENDAFIRDNIKEKNKTNKNPGVLRLIADAFAQIFGTIKKIATKDKKVGLFLVAFFLYIDGVGTIIDNCINIGTDLKLDSVGQVVFLLFTQIVACIGSLVFGRLSQTYKTTTLLYVCIAGYFAVCLYALTLHDLIGFGIMAFGVGCFQGSLQALSRSYFSKIIPPENSGEYFGIYDIFAKGASFLGSLVIASVKLAGGTINVAVATMAIFFAVGFAFLRLADRYDAPRHENN